jgi:hypothetical protein
MSIFRKEALEYQCVRLSGTVYLKADRRTTRMAFGFIALAVLSMFAFERMEVSSSAPLSCRVTAAHQALIGPPAMRVGAGVRLERIDIATGVQVVTLDTPTVTPGSGGERVVPLDKGATVGPCVATARFALRPAQLIVAKLTKQH